MAQVNGTLDMQSMYFLAMAWIPSLAVLHRDHPFLPSGRLPSYGRGSPLRDLATPEEDQAREAPPDLVPKIASIIYKPPGGGKWQPYLYV